MLMSTKAQRLRVAELLDGLACQSESWNWTTDDVMTERDSALGQAAWDRSVMGRRRLSWREHYAEAAQLLREGSVK